MLLQWHSNRVVSLSIVNRMWRKLPSGLGSANKLNSTVRAKSSVVSNSYNPLISYTICAFFRPKDTRKPYYRNRSITTKPAIPSQKAESTRAARATQATQTSKRICRAKKRSKAIQCDLWVYPITLWAKPWTTLKTTHRLVDAIYVKEADR